MLVENGLVYALLGAGIAMGMAGISTAIGVASAGVSGAGAVAENKENFKNAMILQAMPQTQTIYAFITALFIVMGTGLLAGAVGAGEIDPEMKTQLSNSTLAAMASAEAAGVPYLDPGVGLAMLGAGLLVGLTSVSAVAQGKISGAGIAACAKNPDAFAPSIIFSGQAETPAIFGFVVALIILVVGLAVL